MDIRQWTHEANDKGVEMLRYMILDRACKDYIEYALTLKVARPYTAVHSEAARGLEEVTSFFLSGWFILLTDLDGRYMLDKLDRRVEQEWRGQQTRH